MAIVAHVLAEGVDGHDHAELTGGPVEAPAQEFEYLPNSSDFMNEFKVSRRTVSRDLDFLRDEERAPLAYDARHPPSPAATAWQAGFA